MERAAPVREWFSANRIAVQPLSDTESQQLAGDIDAAELREAIHCFDSDGRAFRGARALRHIGMRLPLMVPLAALPWVLGVIFLAERAYSFISRSRHLLSRVLGCSAGRSVRRPQWLARGGRGEVGPVAARRPAVPASFGATPRHSVPIRGGCMARRQARHRVRRPGRCDRR